MHRLSPPPTPTFNLFLTPLSCTALDKDYKCEYFYHVYKLPIMA